MLDEILNLLGLARKKEIEKIKDSIVHEYIGAYSIAKNNYDNNRLTKWSYYKQYWKSKGSVMALYELWWNLFPNEPIEDLNKKFKGE